MKHLLLFSLYLIACIYSAAFAQSNGIIAGDDLPDGLFPAEVIIDQRGDIYGVEDWSTQDNSSRYSVLVELTADLDRAVLFDTRDSRDYDLISIESIHTTDSLNYLVGSYFGPLGGVHVGVFSMGDSWQIGGLLASIEIDGTMSQADKDCYYIRTLQEYHCTLGEDPSFSIYKSHIRAVITADTVFVNRQPFPDRISGTAATWLDTVTTQSVVDRGDSLFVVDRYQNVLLKGLPSLEINGARNPMSISDIIDYDPTDSVATLMGFELGLSPRDEGQLVTYTYDFRSGESTYESDVRLEGAISRLSMKYSLSDIGEVTFYQFDNATLGGGIGDAHLWVYDRSRQKVDSLALGITAARIISAERLSDGRYLGSAGRILDNGDFRFFYWISDAISSTVDHGLSDGFTIYPNPTRSLITVSDQVSVKKYYICDMYGQLIQQGRRHNGIVVSSLPSGSYVLKVLADDGRVLVEQFTKLN